MNSEARFKLIAARTELLFRQAFFGTLAMRLRLVEDCTMPTMYTDGEILGYNPFYVLQLTNPQAMWSICHEIFHAANGHCWRIGARDFYHWNIATDAVINQTLKTIPVLEAPKCIKPVDEPTCAGKSAEWAYAHLPRRPPPPGGNGGDGQGGSGKSKDPGFGCGCDGPRKAPEGGYTGQGAPTESEWQVAVTQAVNAAKQAGQLPTSLEHLVGKLTAPRVDWRAALRRFVQDFATADYTWRQPNRKYVASGMYLPTLRSEQMPPLVVAIDTSGSISNQELVAFFSETLSIIDECKPLETHIIQCDASVKRPHDIIERGDGFAVNKIKVHGRGGTSFNPVFDYVKEKCIDPVCLIYLTDLECWDTPKQPDYEVLWVSTTDGDGIFGETIHLNDGGIRR